MQWTDNDWIALGTVVGALATVALVLLAVLGPIANWRRSRLHRGAPKLDVEPTGGPGTDLRLVVTNRGLKGEFHGTASVVAARNYPNRLRQGSYSLMWLGLGTSSLTLNTGQSHAILVARWLMYNDIPPPRMGEVRFIECNGSREEEWDGFRWNVVPNESLPEFDIDVTITGIGISEPFRRSYTLRPSDWIGPLELIERTPAP